MGNFIDLAAVLAPAETVRSVLKTLGSEAGCCTVLPDRTLVFWESGSGEKNEQNAGPQLAYASRAHEPARWASSAPCTSRIDFTKNEPLPKSNIQP